MIVVGTFFFLLAAYHIYSDLQGAESSLVIQLVPIAVLFYALYEYRTKQTRFLRLAGGFL
jgi:drug/metabolite transporter (DMT)-like permease